MLRRARGSRQKADSARMLWDCHHLTGAESKVDGRAWDSNGCLPVIMKRSRDADATPPVVNEAQSWASRRAENVSNSAGYYAFYSSANEAITTNVSLMHIPMDDHRSIAAHC